jgi:hypothetical protein
VNIRKVTKTDEIYKSLSTISARHCWKNTDGHHTHHHPSLGIHRQIHRPRLPNPLRRYHRPVYASRCFPRTPSLTIVTPSADTGFTASDSVTFVEPIIQHAPNQKTMAKQWLHGYQYGPLWVPPLVAPGTIANLYLAYLAHATNHVRSRNLYIAAAVGIWSILPITFFYMEPGINGASKWKVESLLKDEGFKMEKTTWWYPSAHRHGSTQASRRWAEGTDMRSLIVYWRKVNNWRAVVALLAGVGSGVATFSQMA